MSQLHWDPDQHPCCCHASEWGTALFKNILVIKTLLTEMPAMKYENNFIELLVEYSSIMLPAISRPIKPSSWRVWCQVKKILPWFLLACKSRYLNCTCKISFCFEKVKATKYITLSRKKSNHYTWTVRLSLTEGTIRRSGSLLYEGRRGLGCLLNERLGDIPCG